MKIRIKFAKYGNLKYIGHLDIMRCFQKIMRRAQVDIAYTGGFSPHQIMSFASPLGLGLTSEGEYVDIEVNSTESSENMISRINAVSVEGIEILGYVVLPDKCKTAMSQIAAADYELHFRKPWTPDLVQKFKEFLAQDSIVITKQTKKQELQVDIAPLVYEWKLDDDLSVMFMQVSAGSAQNLKPEQVMDAFAAYAGVGPDALAFHVHRLEMYTDLSQEGEPRKLVSLLEIGEAIA